MGRFSSVRFKSTARLSPDRDQRSRLPAIRESRRELMRVNCTLGSDLPSGSLRQQVFCQRSPSKPPSGESRASLMDVRTSVDGQAVMASTLPSRLGAARMESSASCS